MNRRLLLLFLIGLFLVCCYASSYRTLLKVHDEVRQTSHSMSGIWNLPPVALLAIAGEFKGLVADYLTLEAGAQLGTQLIRKPEGGFQVVQKQYDWPNIHRLFVASQTLDPYFGQTYIVMQGTLPWQPANMVAEAQKFLKITAQNRLWDWQPTHAMGFNAYYFLNQPGEAGRIFLEAAQVPNAPSFLSILGARLAQKGGETETAIVIMKSMLANKSSEEPGYADMLDRLQALEGVFVIEKAVTKYVTVLGRKPSSLVELVDSEVLEQLPVNPYDLSYCIDTAGKIYFDKPDCLTSAETQGNKK